MWMNAQTTEPKKDGFFIVMRGIREIEETTMYFTVSGGWNTMPGSENKRNDPDYINNDGYIKAWFQVPKYNPAEVAG